MKRFVVAFLVVFLAVFSLIPFNSQENKVYGESNRIAVGQVTATILNVRSEATSNSKIIAKVAKGAKISIYEKGVNKDWLKVKINNQWGFVHRNFVTVIETFLPAQTNIEKVADGQVKASNLNVRSEPKTTASKINVLANGTKVVIYELAVNKDWLKIKIGSKWGYVHASYVTISQSSSAPAPSTPPAPTPVITEGKVTASTLNVRSEAKQTATRISTLSAGTKVDIYETGVNKDWLKIKIGSKWGYVHANYVTISQSSSAPAPATPSTPPAPAAPTPVITEGKVTASTLNVRSEAKQTATRIGTVSAGTQVDIYETGVNKDWLKIKIGSKWGYVHASYVTITPNSSTPAPAPTPATPTPVITEGKVTASTLNVRSEADQTATRISTVSAGTQVDIYETGVNKDWLKIKIGSQWGYVHASYVTILGTATNSDTSKLKNKVIVIDSGHGGRDPGAASFSLTEKDIVLTTSLLLQNKLQQAGANVVMTRTSDSFLTLSERTKIANNENADVFISLHVNSAAIATAHGTEIFWSSNFQSANSKVLATSLQAKIVNTLGTRDRGVKEADFAVIKYTQMPSALIELGFLSNYNEAQRLANPQFQEQAADAMLEGIVDYYNR